MASVETTTKEFLATLQKRQHFQEALSLMEWDARTGAPRKGAALRAEARGTLADEIYQLDTSERFGECLNILSEAGTFESLTPIMQRLVTTQHKEYDRRRKVPQERNRTFQILASKSESVWEEAKETSNFSLFEPYLEQVVAMKREFVGYWGYSEHPYDTLMDQFEPGLTVAKLDPVFSYVRDETVKLVQRIAESPVRPNPDILRGSFVTDKQRAVSVSVLKQMGYDFGAGRLDETVHPFQISINRYDVRATTNFREDDLTFALFSTMHEGGHALYEQGVSPDLIGTPLCEGASLGIHESQSRFWENMIGLSHPFWEANYAKLQAVFPHFEGISMDAFYRAVNHVEPSLIRIEADELTYNLHIMIRYELEKLLITNQIQVRDLPELWRVKMKEYLGVTPDSDAEGVLQDVHWSSGDIGYFPTYSLGNIYAAQFRNQLAREIPDYLEQVRRGHLLDIKVWFNEKVHQYGKMLDPVDIVVRVTGEEPNAKYLVDYLNQKFTELYQL